MLNTKNRINSFIGSGPPKNHEKNNVIKKDTNIAIGSLVFLSIILLLPSEVSISLFLPILVPSYSLLIK